MYRIGSRGRQQLHAQTVIQMADLGTDIHCVSDMEPTLRVISGREALAHAIARRLQTPFGGLWYDPDYGYDLRQFCSGQLTQASTIASSVELEALKDERVLDAKAAVTVVGKTLDVKVTLTDGLGPFTLVIGVDALTLQLLNPGG